MKEHALPQRQEKNAVHDIGAYSPAQERQSINKLESPDLIDRLFAEEPGMPDVSDMLDMPDVSNMLEGPGLDRDFSMIPAHTDMPGKVPIPNRAEEPEPVNTLPAGSSESTEIAPAADESPQAADMTQSGRGGRVFTPTLSQQEKEPGKPNARAPKNQPRQQNLETLETAETAETTETKETAETAESAETTTTMEQSRTDTAEPGSERAEAAVGPTAETIGPALLVEDSVPQTERGQMNKREFLAQLRAAVTKSVEEALVGTGRTTADCPYLNYWFDFYIGQDSRHIERAIHKYAPESINVSTAAGYIATISQRARQAANIWVLTGKITGVPEGVPIDLSGAPPVLVDNDGEAPKEKVQKTKTKTKAKAETKGETDAHHPQTIQKELGEGRPLDTRVRSRMESVFSMDFSHVRTHTDARAVSLSNRYHARAFTVGEHIAFGPGEYLPGTLTGDSLIAHELVHVAQQRGARVNEPGHTTHTENTSHTALEDEADWAAAGMMISLLQGANHKPKNRRFGAAPFLKSGLQLQRCAATQRPSATAAPLGRTLSIFAIPQTPPSYIVRPGAPVEAGPLHLPAGEYEEFIRWSTINSNGFIVQEVNTTYNVTDCGTGTANTDVALTPRFWEAWEVDGRGNVSPDVGGVNDMWVLGPRPNTEGNWSARARVYFVEALDPNAHFARGNVPESGPLLFSTTTPPNNLGPSLLGRSAGGNWDCSGTHTPA